MNWRKPYSIKVKSDCVYVDWRKPIENWGRSGDRYLEDLWACIKRTVSEKNWDVLTNHNGIEDQAYVEYVNDVKAALVSLNHLHSVADDIRIGNFHDTLVIAFPTSTPSEFPTYFRGIQLKPHLPLAEQNGAAKT